MSKDQFTISAISKAEAALLLNKFHYLTGISKGFKSGINFGLFIGGEVVGACIFTGFPVPELAAGAFGLPRSEQRGLFELSRLVLRPDIQATEHNVASWFVSRCLKMLKADHSPRAVLSYADDEHHHGTVYAACNFTYFGMAAEKKDFWFKQPNGDFIKHSRGRIAGREGEWRPRSRKHRFMVVFDKALDVKWPSERWRPRA